MIKLLILFLAVFHCTFAVQKLYEIFKIDNCVGDQPVFSVLIVSNASLVPNKVLFSGYLEVKEKVQGPLEISFDANRCDFTMKKCEKYSSIKVPGVCDVLQGKIGLFDEALKNIQPRISCPMMPGKYTAKDSVLDLSTVSVFPTEGFIWLVTVKFISGEGKNKKLAMCLQTETKISKVRERRKKIY